MDRNSANLALDRLGLAHVEPGADLEAKLSCEVTNRERAADRVGRHLERREQPVASGVDLPPAEPLQPIADRRVVPAEEPLPGGIANPRGELGRADDVYEQDRCEEAAGLVSVAPRTLHALPGAACGQRFFSAARRSDLACRHARVP